MTSQIRSGIVETPLDLEQIIAQLTDVRCGGVVTFCGVVRNHDAGRDVTAIDYCAHPSAEAQLRDLAEQATLRHGVHTVAAWHRVGHIVVGETAMVVVVAAEHRSQAFTAAQALVDEIKATVPVWKCQILADGSRSWTGL